jgi:nicotinate-nucleotide pyrophosphorylase
VTLHARSGDLVEPGAPLLSGEGSAAGLLRAWKVAQTLVEIWSGVATATRALVSAARSVRPGVSVACTRKNVPGTKALAVAAIKAGGAVPHRLGLSETILLFPEHRAFLSDADLADTARSLRSRAPEPMAKPPASAPAPAPAPTDTEPVIDADVSERERLVNAMERAGWVQAKAARILGVTPR